MDSGACEKKIVCIDPMCEGKGSEGCEERKRKDQAKRRRLACKQTSERGGNRSRILAEWITVIANVQVQTRACANLSAYSSYLTKCITFIVMTRTRQEGQGYKCGEALYPQKQQ